MTNFKYPRTAHLPWSQGKSSDDKVVKDISSLDDFNVIVTEKMDGENTVMGRDFIHARSIDSDMSHPSRTLVKSFWAGIRYEIPSNIIICGENMYAKHSIGYDNLPSYFIGFGAIKLSTYPQVLGWEETEKIFTKFNITAPNILWEGLFKESSFEKNVHPIILSKLDLSKQEGYVLRPSGNYLLDQFSSLTVKWVRNGHVQTDEHWLEQPLIKNTLKVARS